MGIMEHNPAIYVTGMYCVWIIFRFYLDITLLTVVKYHQSYCGWNMNQL